ncbi:MAG: hypothetical protein HOV71_05140 [Hamadaea sp.]|nr:hypothetical protein [Hamadaea sp.]
MMKFFDASQNAELEPVALILGDVMREAERVGADIMVVGAAARDILIRQVIGIPPSRATADVDVAIAVSSWAEVAKLSEALEPAGSVHRFRVRGTDVDIIPFGEIETEGRTITWPNDHMMDVFGFREAFAHAVTVRMPSGADVAVASLPAQSLLKLFAWRDRRDQDRRDAIDFRSILDSYQHGPYFDELYETYGDLVEINEYVPGHAAAHRMGMEASRLIALPDHRIVLDLLDDKETGDRLVEDMGGLRAESSDLVSAYRRGFASAN